MTSRKRRAALVLAALPTAGCGTAANLANNRTEDGGRLPFGGVAWDARHLFGDQGRPVPPPDAAGAARLAWSARSLLFALDIPLSLVGDVLTWPYTKAYTFANEPFAYPVFAPAGGPAAISGATLSAVPPVGRVPTDPAPAVPIPAAPVPVPRPQPPAPAPAGGTPPASP